MATLLNAMIGEYRVVASLGSGGMGEVYKAVHTHHGRVIAIKVLLPSIAGAAALQRFCSEAAIQASLRHPGLAEYLGFYEYQGRPCMLMEFVDGETLSEIIARRGPLPAPEALTIAREVAAVAAHFHAQGVVHRDLKSTNIKITSARQVKVLDFGIARHASSTRLTQLGSVIGTPEALAPEQLRGEPVTPATDVWQLGALLFEMLTGRLPFQGASTQETFAQILSARVPSLRDSQADVPAGLEKVVVRCLHKQPKERYATAAALHEALSAVRTTAAPPLPRTRLVAALALALFIITLGGIGLWMLSSSPTPTPVPVPVSPNPVESNTAQAATRAVLIDTADGAAQVFREGRLAGTTPLRILARPGERVEVVLRREGFKDLALEFEATERQAYTYTLEPLKGRH
jgi:eukaryotic-like serine/threonine-protein kinase